MFILLTNAKTGKPTLLNLDHIDQISEHESGNGTQIWSTKEGIGGHHVSESFSDVFYMFRRNNMVTWNQDFLP